MANFERTVLRKRIVSFYLSQTSNRKYFTYLHFKEEGEPSSTIYSIISKYEKTGEYEDLSRSGRPARPSNFPVDLVKVVL